MTHEIETAPCTWYTYNVTDSCTVREIIDGETATLSVLATGGTGIFFASGNSVTLETNGKFRILPTKAPVMQTNGGNQTVDQTYTPDSPNSQSGTAVAQAFSAGSTVVPQPAGVEPYTLKQGAALRLDPLSDTLELLPSTLTTAQEMRVLYTPAEARTTPLIAVPQGVTLHWAGDAEPTWESGKDYVIQLLQTAPTHIEARLFNAPQGAKLPEWLKAPYIVHKNGVAVAADFEGQINGSSQFYNNPESVKALEEQLKTATFNQQTNGERQFYGFKGQLSLPLATFAAQTAGTFQFMSSSDDASLYLPRATFESLSGLPVNFFYGCNIVVAPSAVFGKVIQFTIFNGSVNRRDDRHADFASATFERLMTVDVIVDTAPVILKLYSLNLRVLNYAANCFPNGPAPERFNEHWRESLLSLVYGPRLQVDESGAFVRNAAGNCVAAPVLKTDPVSGEPVSLEPEELTGRRFMPADAGDRPTGWGIQDFRELDENRNFARKADGSYKHKSAGHSIKVPVTDSAQSESMGGSAVYGADIAAALQELSDRGWTLAWARII